MLFKPHRLGGLNCLVGIGVDKIPRLTRMTLSEGSSLVLQLGSEGYSKFGLLQHEYLTDIKWALYLQNGAGVILK